jgi:hypothetical protein
MLTKKSLKYSIMRIRFHRHKRIFLIVGVVLFYLIFLRSSDSSLETPIEHEIKKPLVKDEIRIKHEHEHQVANKHGDKPLNHLKERVNIYNYIKPVPCSNCPGENGAAVQIMPNEETAVNQAMKKEFFNSLASERVSLWRSLPDTRFEE